MLSIAVDLEVVEAHLAAGRLCCPVCAGPLARWGFARERDVRTLDGVCSVRPRRAYCQRCDSTHVLLPAFSLPRRRDSAEVIGHALVLKAQGVGHRRIAARLGRPPGTVRGWLRAFARRAQALACCARRWLYAIDQAADPPGQSSSSLIEALDALGTAVRAARLCLDTRAGPWELTVALTGGLLNGPVRDPPRS